jgi:hypothetical protein
VAIVAILVALALAGAVIAYDAIGDEARQEVSATPPAPKPPTSTAGGAKDGQATETQAAEREGAAGAEKRAAERRAADRRAAEPAAAGADGLVKKGKFYTWPRTLEAYTVVLLSAEDMPSATAFANGVADRKSAKTGVIKSDEFKSLPQGVFIVFAGVYDSRGRAERAVERLSGRYPGAFAQLVRR